MQSAVQRAFDGEDVELPTFFGDNDADTVSKTCAAKAVTDPRWLSVARDVMLAAWYKECPADFSASVHIFRKSYSDAVSEFVARNAAALDALVQHGRDQSLTYFGVCTLKRSYGLRGASGVVERPQLLFMRVAVGIHVAEIQAGRLDAMESISTTYEALSTLCYTHATPTLFNAGTRAPQLASCFLLDMKGDSIDGIYDTLKECAEISKHAGGVGLNITRVRAAGSKIRNGGRSSGIVPMTRVFNATARYVDQAGRRKGSFALYLEPWHADVEAFLELRKNHGDEELRARDVFTALWVPDEFMRRLASGADWSLFCPNEVIAATGHDLGGLYGEAFDDAYRTAEATEGLVRKSMPTRQLWQQILDSQIQTGTPYMLYKDAANKKSNHQHLGTIRCSNLCVEIIQYSSADETAVCNLASICLPAHVIDGVFDYKKLRRTTHTVVGNLNRVIDCNMYPVPEAERSNRRHRPIGIGVQGMADVFMELGMSYESDAAKTLNAEIFETIYYAAVEMSMEIAAMDGPYDSFAGSPASQARLQPHLWSMDFSKTKYGKAGWDELGARVAQEGMRNSLLIAPMPTASSAQIMGNTESFEPLTSNMYVRRTLGGEFVVTNMKLFSLLRGRGKWDEATRAHIMNNRGSVATLPCLTEDEKAVFKTAFEMRQRAMLDHAAARAPFIDQSQSMNAYFGRPNPDKLTAYHLYAWRAGLKTGMYYLRSLPSMDPIQFTIDERITAKAAKKVSEDEGCVGCSS